MEETADTVPLPAASHSANIGIVYNLKKGIVSSVPDAEAEYDSIDTVYAIRDSLERAGLQVTLLEVNPDLLTRLTTEKIDIVFNIAEGLQGRGREAQIPALLNMLGIPFTGSDETTLCVALDKALTKRVLSTYRIRTPRYTVILPNTPFRSAALQYPVIVKPDAEGSSKGISNVCIAANHKELKDLCTKNIAMYNQAMLVEEYLSGREFTLGVLGNGEKTRVFSPMEICFQSNTQGEYKVYSYAVKREYEKYITYQCPAQIPDALTAEMMKTARRIYEILGCRDFARIDFRLSAAGVLYFIEINPLPGLAPGYSDYPMLAQACGMSYDELILSILRAGAERCGVTL